MQPTEYKIGDSEVRPWGCWAVLDVAPSLVVKRMTIEAGKRLSLQRHSYRTERWIMMQGVATVQRGDEVLVLRPGDGIMIPCHCPHRLTNDGSEPVSVLEVQFGELLSEDDIERFDDDFGRTE